MPLCNHRACRCALVLPVRLQNTNGLVVSAQTVDSGLDQDESELGVLVLAVALQVLADGDCLLFTASITAVHNMIQSSLARGREMRVMRTFLINM
jgi:translation initiation factor 6 (eIF-6)